jgi:Domain of unknown function (DUF4383)
MSVRIYSAIFGILLIIFGLLPFFPQYVQNGHLFSLFTVNPIHVAFYVITGLIGLLVSFVTSHASRAFFRVFGIIFLLIAILAFMLGGNISYLQTNSADDVLHLIIGAIFSYFGFGRYRGKQTLYRTDYTKRRPPEDRENHIEHERDVNHEKRAVQRDISREETAVQRDISREETAAKRDLSRGEIVAKRDISHKETAAERDISREETAAKRDLGREETVAKKDITREETAAKQDISHEETAEKADISPEKKTEKGDEVIYVDLAKKKIHK